MNTTNKYDTAPGENRSAKDDIFMRCTKIQTRAGRPLIFGGTVPFHMCDIEVPSEIEDPEVEVIRTAGSSRCRVEGVRSISWTYPLRKKTMDYITFVSPAVAWMMLAPRIGLENAVLLGDSMLRRTGRRYLGMQDLRDTVDRFISTVRKQGRRLPFGFETCVLALELVRENTDSFMETRLRLLLQRCGVRGLRVNETIEIERPDPGWPKWKIRQRYLADLSIPELKLAIEYDGRHHAEQWEDDVRRQNDIGGIGWTRIAATHEDMRTEAAQLGFVRTVARYMALIGGKEQTIHEPIDLRELALAMRRTRKRGHDVW